MRVDKKISKFARQQPIEMFTIAIQYFLTTRYFLYIQASLALGSSLMLDFAILVFLSFEGVENTVIPDYSRQNCDSLA